MSLRMDVDSVARAFERFGKLIKCEQLIPGKDMWMVQFANARVRPARPCCSRAARWLSMRCARGMVESLHLPCRCAELSTLVAPDLDGCLFTTASMSGPVYTQQVSRDVPTCALPQSRGSSSWQSWNMRSKAPATMCSAPELRTAPHSSSSNVRTCAGRERGAHDQPDRHRRLQGQRGARIAHGRRRHAPCHRQPGAPCCSGASCCIAVHV